MVTEAVSSYCVQQSIQSIPRPTLFTFLGELFLSKIMRFKTYGEKRHTTTTTTSCVRTLYIYFIHI